jgi:aspartate/methionine/tyrosine aminotransferase
LRKLGQRIGLIAAKANSVQETKIAHNMFVCQVATFSPICIHMSLKECADIDKQIIKAYQYRLNICIPMLNLGALL